MTGGTEGVEALAEKLLDGMTPFERSKARTLAEGCEWAGLSRAELYRAVERGELEAERASAAPRKNGRRAGTKILLTLESLARFRAARTVAADVKRAGEAT